jgi:hypothetical protein
MNTSRPSGESMRVVFEGALYICPPNATNGQQQTTLQRKALSLFLRLQHPEWSDERVANEAGYKGPRQLYRMAEYRRLKDAKRDGKGRLPRGTRDAETGRVEAWFDDDQDQ